MSSVLWNSPSKSSTSVQILPVTSVTIGPSLPRPVPRLWLLFWRKCLERHLSCQNRSNADNKFCVHPAFLLLDKIVTQAPGVKALWELNPTCFSSLTVHFLISPLDRPHWVTASPGRPRPMPELMLFSVPRMFFHFTRPYFLILCWKSYHQARFRSAQSEVMSSY